MSSISQKNHTKYILDVAPLQFINKSLQFHNHESITTYRNVLVNTPVTGGISELCALLYKCISHVHFYITFSCTCTGIRLSSPMLMKVHVPWTSMECSELNLLLLRSYSTHVPSTKELHVLTQVSLATHVLNTHFPSILQHK